MTWSRKALFFTCLLACLLVLANAELSMGKLLPKAAHELSVAEIEDKLQTCSLVKDLNKHKLASAPDSASLLTRLFDIIFPGSPAVNSLLATLYISGPPTFLLGLCPPDVDPSSLSIMVAFAVGGLLGDTLFHLLPEIFLGEDSPTHVRFVMVEPNKNLLLGLAIMVGFLTFVAMDKTLRIATGGAGGHDHSHGHGHSHEQTTSSSTATTTATEKEAATQGLKNRSTKPTPTTPTTTPSTTSSPQVSSSMKLTGYLNMFADFTHNITDGLAIASSFYASPTIGATTTVAIFFHEVPHQVGDAAMLMQAGFSKKKALLAQFVTATGAVLGAGIGIAVQGVGAGSSSSVENAGPVGLLGTSLTYGDLLLPFTAGTFLYVGTVAVIPELLETGPNAGVEIRKTLMQFAAIAAGAAIMLAISWD